MHGVRIALAFLSLVLVVAAAKEKPDFCGKYACPYFKKQQYEGYQIRTYEGRSRWAASSGDLKKEMRTMFFRVFNYTRRDNERRQQISMTVPVLTKKTAGSPISTMFFYLSIANPPQPNNPEVILANRDNSKVYVRVFKKFVFMAFDGDFEKEADKLRADLDRDNRPYDKRFYYQVGYTSPFYIGERHYEVWIDVPDSN